MEQRPVSAKQLTAAGAARPSQLDENKTCKLQTDITLFLVSSWELFRSILDVEVRLPESTSQLTSAELSVFQNAAPAAPR